MPLSNDTLAQLRNIVSAENVLTSTEDLVAYSFDGTAAMSQTPGCIVFALTTEHIAQILKLANATKTPVVTLLRGAARVRQVSATPSMTNEMP